MSYSTAAHVRHPYGGFFVDPATTIARNWTPIVSRDLELSSMSKRVRGAVWFVSNCESIERLRVARAMAEWVRRRSDGDWETLQTDASRRWR